MDFTKGNVYKVVLSHTLEGELLPYPIILIGKCITTTPQYTTLLDPQTNIVKGFKKSQMAQSEPYDCSPVAVKSNLDTKPAKPEVKPAAKPEVKPEVKPAAKPEVKPAAKPEVKPAAKPEVKPAKPVEPSAPVRPSSPSIEKLKTTAISIIESILKKGTPFTSELTNALITIFEQGEDCDLRTPNIIPLQKGKCIYYKDKEDMMVQLRRQYPGNLYLLSTTELLTSPIEPTTPMFVVSLPTKNETYLLK